MKSLVRDLHRPRPWIYWIDLLSTCALGWTAFGAAIALKPFSAGMLTSIVLAVCALYRALCFMHEITHQSGPHPTGL